MRILCSLGRGFRPGRSADTSKMAKDTKFRADVAERIGLSFELSEPETVEVVPNVPRFQKTEVTVSI